MRAGNLTLIALTFVVLASSNRGMAQDFVKATASIPAVPRSYPPFARVGIGLYAGLGGGGVDLAAPLARKFNLRAGAEYFSYSTTFHDQGANVAVQLRLQSGHASLDWLPFTGHFRLSPLFVFINDNRARATALVPPGSKITLNGQDYISSLADPLHGARSVDFREVSPGFTLGWGNIVPRTGGNFSFPVEAGFYYVGHPGLKVSFTGNACDPTQPPAIGCESVNQDAGFHQSLSEFIAHNNHDLSYATFLPIFRFGFGYSFHGAK
jgi:hypothetical protein